MKSLMIGTIIVSVCLPFINYEVEASLTEAEELALASGSDFDRKILAQKIAAKGNLPNFLASLGAENPDILNLQSQINNAKVAVGTIQPGDPTLANRIAAVQQIIPGISLINGAQQIQAKVATAIAVLDSTPNQTLPGATQAVTNVVSTGGVGGNRGANVLTDVTAARDALPNAGGGDLKARALAIGGTVNTAITALDTTAGQTLPGATQAVNDAVSTGGVGGNRGADVLTDVTAARDALPNAGAGDLKARALAVGGTVNTAITALDTTAGQTLPGATQAVSDAVSTGGVGGNRGADVLTDVTAARNALPNAGGGDLKARALAIGGTVNTAITALDTTVGQTLPGATQAVTNVVSTGGVGGNRGADVLTDVTAARDALPNAGAGDLKARALAVGGTINTAISEIDPVKTTLPAAVTSIMDTPTNYNSVWNFASGINPAYVVGAGTGNANEASLRNEIIILLNIIQSINQTTHQITRPDGLTANHSNVTLRDLIRFLSQRTSLQ